MNGMHSYNGPAWNQPSNMPKPNIPLAFIDKLRCVHCRKFITSGPVHIVPSGGQLCGRCQHIAKPEYRNYSFEAVANLFLYPCCNWENHCNLSLGWGDSANHEELCSYEAGCSFFCAHPRAYCKSRRKIPTVQELGQCYISEDILDNIKCRICECYLSFTPVFIQPDGQNICHRCINSNGFPANCMRNIPYEQLASLLIFPCIYRNRGCPVRERFSSKLWEHEQECSYGQMFKKKEPAPAQAEQKKRGVIKTHTGHFYGTLNQNAMLFAPPTMRTKKNKNKKEDNLNDQLIKSIKRKHEEKLHRTPEFDQQTDFVDGRSTPHSDGSAPSEYDGDYFDDGRHYPQQNMQHYYPQENMQAHSSHQQQHVPRQYQQYPPENYSNQPYPGQQYGPQNYSNQPYQGERYMDDYYPGKKVSRNNSANDNWYNPRPSNFERYPPMDNTRYPPVDRKESFRTNHVPTHNNNNNVIMQNVDLERSDSHKSDTLVRELNMKMKKMNKPKLAGFHEIENPYKRCENLDDVINAEATVFGYNGRH